MSTYPSFGYTFPGIPSTLASTQLLTAGVTPGGSGTSGSSSAGTRCCETGRPVVIDPSTGQTICSCQYNSYLYSRMASLTADSSPYGTAGYVPIAGTDATAFCTASINGVYGDLKGSSEAWKSLSSPYCYDPSTLCYPSTMCYPYPTGYGGIDSARRKNATRESTNTLKAWLYEHRKNPYPTKGEKIMLAIITKMTLTQVSTWFANARRRLKKENKMTWSPRNRTGDEEGDAHSEGDQAEGDSKADEGDSKEEETKLDVEDLKKDEFDKILDGDSDGEDQGEVKQGSETLSVGVNPSADCKSDDTAPAATMSSQSRMPSLFSPVSNHENRTEDSVLSDSQSTKPQATLPSPLGQSVREENEPPKTQTQPKPKIWSVADVVTSDESDRKSPRTDTDAVISHQYPSAMNDMRKWVINNGVYSRSCTNTLPYSYPLPPSFASSGSYSLSGVTSAVSSSFSSPSRLSASSLPGYSSSTATFPGLYNTGLKSTSGVGNANGPK